LAALAFTFRSSNSDPTAHTRGFSPTPRRPVVRLAILCLPDTIIMPKDIANPDQVLNCAALSRIDMSGYTSRTPGLYARLCHLCASGKPHSQGTIICEDLS
jgi:hypothetical protein